MKVQKLWGNESRKEKILQENSEKSHNKTKIKEKNRKAKAKWKAKKKKPQRKQKKQTKNSDSNNKNKQQQSNIYFRIATWPYYVSLCNNYHTL